MKSTAELKKKEPYHQPRLLKYGSLAEMTAAGGTNAMTDTVGMGGMKT